MLSALKIVSLGENYYSSLENSVQWELTILMKAERKTMMMVKTPTRVLFSLDWTILLERVCRGTGKSWRTDRVRQWVMGTEGKIEKKKKTSEYLFYLIWFIWPNFSHFYLQPLNAENPWIRQFLSSHWSLYLICDEKTPNILSLSSIDVQVEEIFPNRTISQQWKPSTAAPQISSVPHDQ